MSRSILLFIATSLALHAQSAAFRWVRQIGGSGGQTIAGMGSDSAGNIYVAGNTTSLDFPVLSAIQPQPAGSGLFRLDRADGAWQNLYRSGAIAANDVAFDPFDSRVIYAATRTDILRSADSGDSWSMLAHFDVTNIFAIVPDPVTRGTLYASTSGKGILKSTDAGASWRVIYTGALSSASRVWIDPRRPSVLFTSTSTATFTPLPLRSSDGGATWQPIPDLIALNFPVQDVAFDPFVPGRVYASGASGGGVSTDGGVTWVAMDHVGYPRRDAQVLVADPQRRGVLYGGSPDGLYKSTDSGATWTVIGKILNFRTPFLTLDRATGAIYTNLPGGRLAMTTDGFETTTPVGPANQPAIAGLAVHGGRIFAAAASTSDVFVAKFDPQGNPLYATYLGGIGNDLAHAMTVDSSGAVYVTGATDSLDFPITAGAYSKSGPAFLVKLNPDGTVAWSTYWAAQTNAIAVDAAGHTYLTGTASAGLPVTPGVYQPAFQFPVCIFFCGNAVNGYVTEFDAAGASLVFSTYLGTPDFPRAIALFPDRAVLIAGNGGFYLLDATGSSLIARKDLAADIRSLAPADAGNVLVAGATSEISSVPFPTTPDAFQTVPYRVLALPGGSNGGGTDAFVLRLDRQLNILTSTLLGGESSDVALAAIDGPGGRVTAAGVTASKSLPTRGPIQGSFALATGFVGQLAGDLSSLAFATYTGDARNFYVRSLAAAPDGGIVAAGSTAPSNYPTVDTLIPDASAQVFLVRIDPLAPAAPRIDSVVNAASQLGVPLSPGETIQVRGDGFADDATLLLNGAPLPLIARTATALTAAIPADFPIAAAATVEVRAAAGSASILVPVAAASPGVYPLILNKDGTRNSPDNPAMEGDPITILATGVGTMTFDQGYAVTDAVVDVRVDGFFAAGIAAILGPVEGFPGDVYQISVFVPHPADFAQFNPNLKDFKMPPQVAVTLRVAGATSQAGIPLAVGH